MSITPETAAFLHAETHRARAFFWGAGFATFAWRLNYASPLFEARFCTRSLLARQLLDRECPPSPTFWVLMFLRLGNHCRNREPAVTAHSQFQAQCGRSVSIWPQPNGYSTNSVI